MVLTALAPGHRLPDPSAGHRVPSPSVGYRLLRAPGRPDAAAVLRSYRNAAAGAQALIGEALAAYRAGDAAAVIEAANDAADILIEVARAMRLMLPAPPP